MRYEDTKDFRKALKRLPVEIQLEVIKVLDNLEEAVSFADIHNFKALKGQPNFYRIRVRSYRIGLFWDGEKFMLEAVGIRGDFYKTYP